MVNEMYSPSLSFNCNRICFLSDTSPMGESAQEQGDRCDSSPQTINEPRSEPSVASTWMTSADGDDPRETINLNFTAGINCDLAEAPVHSTEAKDEHKRKVAEQATLSFLRQYYALISDREHVKVSELFSPRGVRVICDGALGVPQRHAAQGREMIIDQLDEFSMFAGWDFSVVQVHPRVALDKHIPSQSKIHATVLVLATRLDLEQSKHHVFLENLSMKFCFEYGSIEIECAQLTPFFGEPTVSSTTSMDAMNMLLSQPTSFVEKNVESDSAPRSSNLFFPSLESSHLPKPVAGLDFHHLAQLNATHQCDGAWAGCSDTSTLTNSNETSTSFLDKSSEWSDYVDALLEETNDISDSGDAKATPNVLPLEPFAEASPQSKKQFHDLPPAGDRMLYSYCPSLFPSKKLLDHTYMFAPAKEAMQRATYMPPHLYPRIHPLGNQTIPPPSLTLYQSSRVAADIISRPYVPRHGVPQHNMHYGANPPVRDPPAQQGVGLRQRSGASSSTDTISTSHPATQQQPLAQDWGLREGEKDKMVYVSWLPRVARAEDVMSKRRKELLAKEVITGMGFKGLRKVLLYPPSSAHCKLLFDCEESARQFLLVYGGREQSCGSERWKRDVCQSYDVSINEGQSGGISSTRVKVIWADESRQEITAIEPAPVNPVRLPLVHPPYNYHRHLAAPLAYS